MRIISQCKTKSVEFYNVALLRRDETIFARTVNQDMLLAEYKTPALSLIHISEPTRPY